jgi:DNA-binding NtrC family response regulator
MPVLPAGGAARILVIDDDHDVGEVVTAILSDEGYEVITLEHISDETVRAAIGRLEPDCILLDGVDAVDYAEAWATAAEVSHRPRPIPTVMFTAHSMDAAEASLATSERAVAAGFFAVLRKPFHLDELVATVERAVAEAVPFNQSERAEHGRTEELVARLTAAGARDVRPSARREWANFRNSAGDEMQLYWWQSAGAYLVARYSSDGARLELVGHYYGLDAAVRAATATSAPE